MDDKKTTFTDSKGRTWTIEITDEALQRIAGLDFRIEPEMRIDPPLDKTLDQDLLRKHQQLIFALIEPEAIRLGVSWGNFWAAMSRLDLLADACEALNNAIAARFPKGHERQGDDATMK